MLCSIRWQQDVYLRQISSPVSPFLKYEEWKVQEARIALSSEVHVWSALVERGFPKTSTFTKLYSPNPSVEQAQWAHIYIRVPCPPIKLLTREKVKCESVTPKKFVSLLKDSNMFLSELTTLQTGFKTVLAFCNIDKWADLKTSFAVYCK